MIDGESEDESGEHTTVKRVFKPISDEIAIERKNEEEKSLKSQNGRDPFPLSFSPRHF
jgi:hypothetical protein